MTTEKYALFSGGHDSLVTTFKAIVDGETGQVIYLDTGSGLPENLVWVRETVEELGGELRVLKPSLSLTEFAIRYGFPAAGAHSWAFRYFKEHALGRLATECDGKPEYLTGVYQAESDRRFRNVKGRLQDRERWVYRSDVWDWTRADMQDYRDDHGLPTNPHAEALGRSPDCFCCAFGSRDECFIRLEANGYEEHAEWLRSVEREVQAEIGTDKAHCWLGNEGMSSKQLRGKIAESDEDQTGLCGQCGWK